MKTLNKTQRQKKEYNLLQQNYDQYMSQKKLYIMKNKKNLNERHIRFLEKKIFRCQKLLKE